VAKANVLSIATSGVLFIVLVAWAIWMWPGAHLIPDIHLDSNTAYLLSGIGQALAAILALVFTISMLVTELSSRYSQRILGGFLDWFTVSYMILFIGAVGLPFWLLAYTSVSGVKTSLVLTTICLVLLPLYFLRLRNKISPENILLSLHKQAANEIIANQGRMPRVPEAIETIDNMIMSASNMKDYLTIRRGVQVLEDLMRIADERERSRPREVPDDDLFSISLEIRQGIGEIAITTTDDPRAIKIIPRVLGHRGLHACERGSWEYANMISVCLIGISYDALHKGSDDLASDAIGFAALLYRNSYEHMNYEQIDDAIFSCSGIGEKAITEPFRRTLEAAIAALGQIGELAAIKRFYGTVATATSQLESLVNDCNRMYFKGLRFIEEAKSAARWIINVGALVSSEGEPILRKELARRLDNVLQGLTSETRESIFYRTLRFPSQFPFDRTEWLKLFIEYYKGRSWEKA
jgi:hypothetical protein